MAYDQKLADRIRRAIGQRGDVTEKRMFGGLAFLRGGKMFCGIANDDLMVRIGPERHQAALAEAHVRPMDFTGRPMNGYIFVGPSGTRTEKLVKRWVDQGAAFVAALDDAATKKRKTPGSARKKTGSSSRSRLNAAWHESHPMPKRPTIAQRLAWHRAHEKNCGCRQIPAKLRAMMK
jgi:TfoX/Sxy family transcriptional regulator of competence genes